ncbi:hypothetical protein ACSBR2_009180 [Camellia fascicularis]
MLGFAGMEFIVLLLCTYRQTNVVLRLYEDSTFAQLVDGVSGKFDGLVPRLVFFLFNIPGYNKFKIVCDDDVQNMLGLRNRSTFLFAGWAYGIKHVGQSFWGGAYEFRSILCNAAVRTFRNLCTGSELVSNVITDHVREQPLTRPTDVVFDMKNAYGLDVSYRVTWLGVEKARGEVYSDHAMSFNQLKWYSNVVMENNPHSYINLDFDQKMGRFVRYFISFHACIDGLNYCRPLLFLNGTFLRADENVFEVQSNPSVLIDVGTRTCSCFQWQLNGFPCPDAVVVFHNSGKDIYEHVNPFYHVKEFVATYYGAIHPVPTIGKPKFTPVDYLIAPSIVKRSPGRPTWKRIPSKGEVVSRIRCGRCGKIGNHNRKACKEPM